MDKMNFKQFSKILLIAVTVLAIGVGAVWLFSIGRCMVISTDEQQMCFIRFFDMSDDYRAMVLSDRTKTSKFLKSCDNFQGCQTALHCWAKEHDYIASSLEKMPIICNSVKYYTTNLADCWDQIEANNSTCLRSWRKFERIEYGLIDLPKEEKMVETKRICDTFVGTDGCLKKELVETCGESMWEDFQDFLAPKNMMNPLCKWGYLD